MPLNPADAVKLLQDLVRVTVHVTNVNARRPIGPALRKEERKAAAALFLALTGQKATDQDIDAIVD